VAHIDPLILWSEAQNAITNVWYVHHGVDRPPGSPSGPWANGIVWSEAWALAPEELKAAYLAAEAELKEQEERRRVHKPPPPLLPRAKSKPATEPDSRIPVPSWIAQPMTVSEFCKLTDPEMSMAMRKRLGIRAGQLFQDAMRGRRAPKRTTYIVEKQGDSRRPWKDTVVRVRHRTNVGVYTFGILKRALNDVVLNNLEALEKPKRKRGRPRKVRDLPAGLPLAHPTPS
jgi:hypothetical protein